MFWEQEICQVSQINEILSKPNCTLDDVLGDELLLQEMRADNQKLIDL
jgi:hypothetical protein